MPQFLDGRSFTEMREVYWSFRENQKQPLAVLDEQRIYSLKKDVMNALDYSSLDCAHDKQGKASGGQKSSNSFSWE
jgi:hypothetical protein